VVSRKQSGVCVLVEYWGGMVVGEELTANPMSLFFLFFLYYVFIVFMYKKLHAALAMEITKPINQNKQQKKPNILKSSLVSESTIRRNHLPT